MAVYNTFNDWLVAQGYGSYLDASGELKDGTSQGFFSSQYTAWLTHIVNYYADDIRAKYGLSTDQQLIVGINQNDASGLPTISGLTTQQVDELFGGTSDFSWTSGSSNKLVTHTRYYSNEFNFLLFDTQAPSVVSVAYGDNDGMLSTGESVTLTVTFDEVVFVSGGTPTLSLDSDGVATYSGGSGTNTLTFTYTVGAGENSSDLEVQAFNLAGATVRDTAGNDAITAGAATNPPGTLIVDGQAPSVTINQSAGQADPANTGPVQFNVVFSEAVTGFDVSDISFAGSTVGGTLSASIAGIGANYTVSVTGMTGTGMVVALIAASAAADFAGNASTASTSTDNSVVFDGQVPSVTINQSAGQADPASTGPIQFNVVFSEAVTGFDVSDISFAGSTVGGTLSASIAGIGANYTVSVTGMSGTGTVVAAIADGAAQDAAGNASTASSSTDNVVVFDGEAPSVTINQAAGQADPMNGGPITFDVVFSEAVTGFDVSDISFAGSTVGGTLAASLAGNGANYTVSVTGMTGTGAVVASITAGAAQDAAGNASFASTSTDNVVVFDGQAPSVTINQSAAQVDPANGGPITFDVVFSEAVTGFDVTDISFAGSTVSGTLSASISGSGASYTVSVTGMSGTGMVVASIDAGAATDAAGNASTASASTDNVVVFDGEAPSVTINQAAGQADPTNGGPIQLNVVFSEAVSGFDASDISFDGSTVGGTLSASVFGSGANYTVSVTGMTGTGTVVAAITAGAAQDGAGNASTASTSTDNVVVFDDINEAPFAGDDVVSRTNESTAITVPEWALLRNDGDVDSPVTLDVGGVIGASDFPLLAFTPDGIGTGNITVSDNATPGGLIFYYATDGALLSATATVSVNVFIGTGPLLTGGWAIGGSTGNEILLGTGFADRLFALIGNDILIGGPGDDSLLDGGPGDDWYGFGLNDGIDTIDDPSGIDRIVIDAHSVPALSGLDFERLPLFTGDTSVDELRITYSSSGGIPTRINVTDHYGSGAIEQIQFLGGASFGGYQLSGVYDIVADPSNPTTGTDGNDVLVGGTAAETLTGLGGNDLLFGHGSVDHLDGGTGDDLLLGGVAGDTYSFAFTGDGIDTISDESGTDLITIAVGGAAMTELDFERIDADLDLVVDDLRISYNGQQIDISNHYAGATIEEITFTGGGSFLGYVLDGVSPYDLSSSNFGTSGADVIASSSFAGGDSLGGGDGNDLLFGNGGPDIIGGGNGNDLLIGGDGNDSLQGGVGSDVLVGGAGADALFGGVFGGANRYVFIATSDSTLSAMDVVFDFTAGDTIDLDTFDFTGPAAAALVQTTPVSFTATDTSDFFNDGGTDRGVAVEYVGTDARAYADANHDGDFTAADDLVIVLANVTSFSISDFVLG